MLAARRSPLLTLTDRCTAPSPGPSTGHRNGNRVGAGKTCAAAWGEVMGILDLTLDDDARGGRDCTSHQRIDPGVCAICHEPQPTPLADTLQQIAEGDWTQDGDTWGIAEDEGQPAWTVTVHEYRDCASTYTLDRESGCYRQTCDAEDLQGVLRLARAMDAAERALDLSVWETNR